jgi:flagellar assembly factor FliW
MCKGGLIMDVVNVEQAKIAEEAGVNIFIPIMSNAKKLLSNFIIIINNEYVFLGLCCYGS